MKTYFITCGTVALSLGFSYAADQGSVRAVSPLEPDWFPFQSQIVRALGECLSLNTRDELGMVESGIFSVRGEGGSSAYTFTPPPAEETPVDDKGEGAHVDKTNGIGYLQDMAEAIPLSRQVVRKNSSIFLMSVEKSLEKIKPRVEATSKEINPSLLDAVGDNDVEAIDMLLAKRATPNISDEVGKTPLQLAPAASEAAKPLRAEGAQ